MKRYSSIIHIVGVACACLFFTGCQTGPGAGPMPANSGHLIVTRVANFGADLGLVLSVDGKDVGSFTEGAQYSGYLSAGQHRLTETLTVQAGQTYSYTAAWSGQRLVLVRNP